ncbi:MAG: hypothetical protein ACI9JM_000485 [Halioglobus sp.]|jgi:hypothetical protein
MKKTLKIVGILLALLVLALSWPAYQIYLGIGNAQSDDPLAWEESIGKLEAKTADSFGPGEAVVFVGSSSIRFWKSLTEDMAPIPVIQHGFGGAKLNDVVYYAERLITNYQPYAVVVFAGTNDIDPAASKSPEVLFASFQSLIEKVRREQPDVPVFYIGITPSVLRWKVWSIAQRTNQLIEQWVDSQSNLYFIDTSSGLLGSDGKPVKENYKWDGLHLSEKGYAIWTSFIRPRLLDELDRY